jgi:hypothetical protein|tara:strand:+ start:2399 stop:2896 length:498 start_codon:yes stop_codon:yes gene_type:complete
MAVLFCNEDKLKSSTALNYNVDTAFLLPHIKVAQDKHIQAIVGSNLYEKLESEIKEGTLASNYKTLVDDYLQDAIIHYALAEALPFISFKIANGTVTQKNSENGTAASRSDVDYLVQKERDTAEFYGQRAIDYIINNTGFFPEYSNNTGEDIKPTKCAYKTGLVI